MAELISFLPVSRGTSGFTEAYLIRCRKPMGYQTHWCGRTVLCAGAGCALCEREVARTPMIATIGSNPEGRLHLVTARDDGDVASIMVAGNVVACKPWKKGQAAKWNLMKQISVATDAIIETDACVLQVCHLFLASHDLPAILGLDWQSKIKHLLSAECRAAADRHLLRFD